MVNTVKFSDFAAITKNGTNTLVGLSNGVNAISDLPINWTTGTRPVMPTNGFSGYNTTLSQWEFWNGNTSSWEQFASGGAGSVTQVDTGTGLTGGPITSSGTISFAAIAANSLWANVTGSSAVPTVIPTSTFLMSASNLSDLPNKATARSNLGVAIGTNVEAWSAILDQISAGIWAGAASITTLGTIATGVWHGSPVGVGFGGTGASSFTAYSVICGGTTSTGTLQNVSGLGSLGQVLTSNGAGGLPTWQNTTGSGTVNSGLINQVAYYAAAGTTVSGLATTSSGTLITDGAGVPSISQTLPAAVQGNITTLGTIVTGVWNGTPVTVPYGGTGNTTFTAYSVICAGTTATGNFENVSGVGALGQVLTSNGAGTLPTWQNVSGTGTVNSGTANQLAYYATTGTTVSGLTSANNGLLVTSNTGVPSILAGSGTTGTILQANAAAAPSWSTATYPGTSGTTGTILRSNGTNWVNSTSTFADTYTINRLLYASSANTVTGLASGNSGVLVTSSSGVPSIIAGGTDGQVLQASTAGTPSWSAPTYPSASGTVGKIIRSDGTNNVYTTTTFADTYAINTLLYASGANAVTGLATSTTAVLTTSAGVPTWAAQLSLALGGTNAALTASNGGIFYSTATAGAILSGTATAGLALLSGASGAPTWSTSKPLTQIGVQSFTATGANTYTPTSGTTLSFVELWGAGAGGGSTNSATIWGNGGGAGAYSADWVANPTSVTINIGTGGTGGVKNNGTAGTDGGDTTYATTVIVAKGGTHAANGVSIGGAGGVAASGTGAIKLSGGQGNSNANASTAFIPGGGSSPRNIVVPALATSAVNAPANSGAGGVAGNSATDASNGGSGYAVVTEFRTG